ncbi:hypothetical protein P0D69_21795 [Paraburkholderia sediminicola]|uniref:hypothetical protein n=1 Tax=Paraburkholderia sediminicola TaxID=458836 RepID=UPI0038B844ED
MSLYQVSANGEGEEVFLERWSIREGDKGTRHFMGYDVVQCDGRVSTPIKSFDPLVRIGRTATGRKYHLLGKAGADKDAEYVWSWAAKAWDITSWKDITPELCPDWRNAVPESERSSIESNGEPGGGEADESPVT